MDLGQMMDTLRDFIRQHYNVPMDDTDFTDDVHLFDYGYVDSFGALDLINFVQDSFAIKITQDDLVACPLNTIRDIAEFSFRRREEN